MNTTNKLKIELYPEKKPRYTFDKNSIKKILPKDTLDHSLNPEQILAYIDSNVPLLNGFYTAPHQSLPNKNKAR